VVLSVNGVSVLEGASQDQMVAAIAASSVRHIAFVQAQPPCHLPPAYSQLQQGNQKELKSNQEATPPLPLPPALPP
jgi:hypothetical protein